MIAPTPALATLYTDLQNRFGFASVEDALSGRGFANIHAVISGLDTPLNSHDILADPAAPQTQQTIALFRDLLARVTANLALSTLPHGGIYFVGGLAVALGADLQDPAFMQAYGDKGRFSDYVKQFPIHVVEDDDTALMGCATHIARVMKT